MKGRRRRFSIPAVYRPAYGVRDTERAIKFIKDYFQNHLARALNLSRISAPMFVLRKTGINDYLNGVERPAGFVVRDMNERAEIVQSLAKWKRAALADYRFKSGEGLYTDMNAIRPDEELDNLHSVYVDQWDWELVIDRSERNIPFLKSVVRKIYRVIGRTENAVCKRYPALGDPVLPHGITFVHSEDLLERCPHMTPQQREDEICRQKGAIFIMGIGAELSDGRPHDGRAADYDDWSTETGGGRCGLNGDIIVWNPVLGHSFELSSMGIRVDRKSLMVQLKIRKEMEKTKLEFHRRLLTDNLPQTIGGGIGQSRLCMFFLRKAHIGEVQASVWPDTMRKKCETNGIRLL